VHAQERVLPAAQAGHPRAEAPTQHHKNALCAAASMCREALFRSQVCQMRWQSRRRAARLHRFAAPQQQHDV
jgi:hypothetical protein